MISSLPGSALSVKITNDTRTTETHVNRQRKDDEIASSASGAISYPYIFSTVPKGKGGCHTESGCDIPLFAHKPPCLKLSAYLLSFLSFSLISDPDSTENHPYRGQTSQKDY